MLVYGLQLKELNFPLLCKFCSQTKVWSVYCSQVARLAAKYNVRIEKIKEGRYIVEGKINIFVRVSVSKLSSFIDISSSVDWKAVDCKASPTGSVLDNSLGLSEQDISL